MLGASDEPVDVSALPWPDAAGVARGVRGRARSSPTVPDAPPGRPLRLVDGLLYLDRYWRQEELVRRSLAERAGRPAARRRPRPRCAPGLAAHFAGAARRTGSGSPRPWRALRPVTVLAGGPGTGKTTTVRRLLALLRRASPARLLRIALAAPTGKAAARLQEAVHGAAARGSRGAAWPTPPPCTGCSAGSRRAAGSGTTAPTGCPTTWSSSTRRRWCR